MQFIYNDRLSSLLCYIIPFICLGGYLFKLIMDGSISYVNGYYLIHYLYTYDHGFIARGLVGEVISWFFDTVTDDLTQKVVILFSFLLMLSAVLCIGKALTKVKYNRQLFFIVVLLSCLICFLPGSFEDYFVDVKLDKLLWALTLFSVFFVDKKGLVFLVPLFCIVATLVNPIFLFCSMILISIILLQEFHSNNYSKKHGIICVVAYLSMIVLGIYALISEKYIGFNTPGELVDFYFSRYAQEINPHDYELFVTEWLFDYFDSMDVILQKSFRIYFIEWENWKTCLADFIFLMIPSYSLLAIFWKRCVNESENRFQKFIFILCLISPIVIIPPIVFSWESSKYFYNNLIVQLSLIIFYIATGNKSVLAAVNSVLVSIKRNLVLFILFVIYFTLVMIVK